MINILLADATEATYNHLIKDIRVGEYKIDFAQDGIVAIKMFRKNSYDIIVIDTHLTELDGLIVCRQIRKISQIPIIFISSYGRESDKLKGFEVGGDDYLTKPFFNSELLARINAVLKRAGNTARGSLITNHGIYIDTKAKSAFLDEIEMSLTPREYAMLEFFMKNANIVFTREQIIADVWGSDYFGTDRTVDTHIKLLRDKLGKYKEHLATVWGVGYIFKT